MTEPTRRPVCGERTLLPRQLALTALEFAPSGAGPEDVERHLRCTLESHTSGDHHALVLDLEGSHAGAVWTSWIRGHAPDAVRVLPDCPAAGPAPGGEPCCEYDGHPGGHTWQLADSWQLAEPWHTSTGAGSRCAPVPRKG